MGMSKHRERMVRTTITLPASLKGRMALTDTNWSELIREAIRQTIEEGKTDMAEAVILNERVRRQAPKGWNSLEAIKKWRRRANS